MGSWRNPRPPGKLMSLLVTAPVSAFIFEPNSKLLAGKVCLNIYYPHNCRGPQVFDRSFTLGSRKCLKSLVSRQILELVIKALVTRRLN